MHEVLAGPFHTLRSRSAIGSQALVLVGLVVGSPSALPARAEQYPIRLFNSADGLPLDAAEEAMIDRDGYLWVKSGNYLTRFDGVEFDVFGSDRGLKDRAQALAQSSDGTIWIGTKSGLQYLAPNGDGRIQSLPAGSPLADDHISAICILPSNDVAVAGRHKVWKVSGSPSSLGARIVYERPEGPSLFTIDCDRTGTIWASGADGTLGRITPDDAATTFLLQLDQLSGYPRGAALDRYGHLWVSTWRGICVGDAAAAAGSNFCRQFIREVGGQFVGFVTGVLRSSDDSILVAGSGEMLRLEPQPSLDAPPAISRIGKAQGLACGELVMVLEDRFGSLWATDSRNGLWRIALRGIRSFGPSEVAHALKIDALQRLRDGTMLAVGKRIEPVPEAHRVQQFNGESWTESSYPHAPGQPDYAWGYNQVVAEDAAGNIWFATSDGLLGYRAGTRIDGPRASHSDLVVGVEQGIPKGGAWRVWADRRGMLWVTALAPFAYRYDPRAIQLTPLTLDAPEGTPWKQPRAYLEDDRGFVWFAYGRGVGRLRSADDWEYLPIADIVGSGSTEDIAFDASGALWVATSAGLYRAADPRAPLPQFTRVWPASGAMPRYTTAVCVGKTGEIYAGTDVGVLVFDGKAQLIEHYGVGSGLPGLQVNALELGADDRVWAGTTRGVAILPPLEPARTQVPDPLLVRVTTPLREIPLALSGQRALSGLTLQPDERALDVFVRSVVMQAQQRVLYRTQLEGVDRDWSPPSAQRQLRIAGLSAGHYVLRIRAEDQSGRASNNESRIEFDVRAPFYERPWFAAAILGALALGALFWQRQQAQRALAIERTRTTIATDLHDEIGAGLSRIAVLSEGLARDRREAGEARAESASEIAPTHVAEIARRLVDRMSDLVWAINPERDRVFSLAQRMRQFATPLLRARGIALQLRAIDEEHDRALDGDIRRELLLIFQESINNAVKHSECTSINVELTLEGESIVLSVTDNGRGFDTSVHVEGTGLSSIQKRATRLGGKCDISATPGGGARVRISTPLRGRR